LFDVAKSAVVCVFAIYQARSFNDKSWQEWLPTVVIVAIAIIALVVPAVVLVTRADKRPQGAAADGRLHRGRPRGPDAAGCPIGAARPGSGTPAAHAPSLVASNAHGVAGIAVS